MPRSATQAELKAAHRRLVRKHHPDLAPPERRPAATRRVQEINVAYGLVRDPRARKAYDALRTERDRAAEWDALVVAAGRWAARSWRRGRRRARLAGLGIVGRFVWLALSAAGMVAGLAVAAAAQRLTGIDGPLTLLAGAVAGALAGSQRGWHRRLRLAGHPVERAAARWGTLLAAAAVAAGLWLDGR